MSKDGTKMGGGPPEYLLLFRKPQTDRTPFVVFPLRAEDGSWRRASIGCRVGCGAAHS